MPADSGATDPRWMCRALDLATRGRCGASPNPMVGAVVLDASGDLAGEGWHACSGGPHAEVMALAEAGERARGGTLYVTLEPCSHHGRTPPCTEAILAAGIRRVDIALPDPNPTAAGGSDRLRAEGIEVTVGNGHDSARMLNRRWLRWARERRPWVTLKAAMSLDGRTATRTGRSKWITGPEARERGLEMREEHDAILVGVGTILADDPQLTRRLGWNPGERWLRVVLDSHLRTPLGARIVRENPELTLLVHTEGAEPRRREDLLRAGVQTQAVEADGDGRPELTAVLDALGRQEVAALMVEGGATVHGAFADADLVDEAVFFVAPILIGGDGPCAVGGLGAGELEHAPRLVIEETARRGEDLEIRAVRPEEADVHRVD